MKILLFDDILERHVRRSLGRALRARGHEVIETPPVWKGHELPTSQEDLATIRSALDEAIAIRPDVLLNFRASTLPAEMLQDLRRSGIYSIVWLPDDPVLYSVCYSKVVDHYDLILNCGGVDVLSFYAERHGISGVNFPFWTDNVEFAHTHDPASTDYDVAFLGDITGPVRSGRYEIIAELKGAVRAFGNVPNDPAQICYGYLDSSTEIATALGPARVGLNIPQFFSDYEGLPHDFPALAQLGAFEFPSRVVQYAAIGLPVLTFGLSKPPATFPEMLVASDRMELQARVDAIRADPEPLGQLATATHQRFQTSFSAETRALFLEALVSDSGTLLARPVGERAQMFADPETFQH